jgi:hypothetical protein
MQNTPDPLMGERTTLLRGDVATAECFIMCLLMKVPASLMDIHCVSGASRWPMFLAGLATWT